MVSTRDLGRCIRFLRGFVLRRLGYVKPEDVSTILDRALEEHTLDLEWDSSTSPPLIPSHWRGRMGLEKEEQLALATAYPP